MRNLLSFFALIISLAGVGISLTREEIRCWVGLSSNACQSSLPLQPPVIRPQSPPTVRQETETRETNRESSPSAATVDTGDNRKTNRESPPLTATVDTENKPTEENVQSTVGAPGLSAPETKPSPLTEPQNSEVAPTLAKESIPPTTSSEKASQPIEVIPIPFR
jgi:hypothetical protein